MNILLDMNLSPDWAPFLVAEGFAAVHWSAVGLARAPDIELLAWARENRHVVFTNDLDFSALLAMTRGIGPSVLQLRLQDLLPDAIGNTVVHVLRVHRDSLEKGVVVTVADNATRVRVLPLQP